MKRMVSMALVSFASINMAFAQLDPLTIWAGGETINNIIGNISDQARDRIAQIEGAGSNLMMEGRTHIIVALQNAEFLAEKLQGKTFAELTEQQKRFFGNLKIALDQFDQSREESFKQIQEVVADLDSALGTIPGSDKSPRMNRYRPAFVVLDQNENFEVTVEGGWLGYGSPTLQIGNMECERKSKTERSLSYSCQKAVLAECDTIRGRSLKLTVYDRPGWFAWLTSWFSDPDTFDYDIGISCVPEKAADIDGVIAISTMVPERRPRGQDFWVGKGHCEGPTSVDWVMNADAANGWQIDVATVRAQETTKVGNTSWQLTNLTSASFAITGSVGNHGECGPKVFGTHVGVDGRGSLGVRVDFEEFRMVPGDSEQKIDSFQMAWGNDYTVAMPNDGKGFVLDVRQIDGKRRVASSNGDYGWFAVEHNIDAKAIHVRVKPANEAFASE